MFEVFLRPERHLCLIEICALDMQRESTRVKQDVSAVKAHPISFNLLNSAMYRT
jgi:hypothetical protein